MMLSGIKNSFNKLCLIALASILTLSSCSQPTDITTDSGMSANSFLGTNFDTNNPFGTPILQNNNFMWGVSSAGYQCEGNDISSSWHYWQASGKTEHKNERGVDFYHRYKEDIALAKQMGVKAFRLGIEWSRIEPQRGYYDPQGIQFYHDVLNELKAQGMTPMVTLVHFNYPQWIDSLSSSGKGLEKKEFIDYFLKYTEFVVKEYGTDVQYWLTFNEPNVWIPSSFLFGIFPPGKRNPISTIKAGWNLLKAHSKAYDLIHKLDSDAMVSSNVFYILPKPFSPPIPPPNSVGQQSNTPILDENALMNSDWFFESLSNGNVAVNKKDIGESNIDEIKTLKNDLKSQSDQVNSEMDSNVGWLKKFDYVSIDYYYKFRNLNDILNLTKPWKISLYPEGLYDALMYYHKKYKKPIIIAENGISTENLSPRPDKWTREAALVEHIKYMKKAMQDGADVRGYFHWSITDNYEWGSFKSRFGLYSVDVLNDPDLKRVPTEAVKVYSDIIKNNGVTTELTQKYKRPSS
jgi:beta-glucosidase